MAIIKELEELPEKVPDRFIVSSIIIKKNPKVMELSEVATFLKQNTKCKAGTFDESNSGSDAESRETAISIAQNKYTTETKYVIPSGAGSGEVWVPGDTEIRQKYDSAYLQDLSDVAQFFKHNSNCPDAEKVGSGPGSCSGGLNPKQETIKEPEFIASRQIMTLLQNKILIKIAK